MFKAGEGKRQANAIEKFILKFNNNNGKGSIVRKQRVRTRRKKEADEEESAIE